MDRSDRISFAGLTTAAFIGLGLLLTTLPGVGLAVSGQAGDRDPLTHGVHLALPPPALCELYPLLDDPLEERFYPSEPGALALEEGVRHAHASRAPPTQA